MSGCSGQPGVVIARNRYGLAQRSFNDTGKSNMADDLVTLFSRFGKVFVWNADDALKIRSKYRIVGSLIGSLPRRPKQNHCFSLPLLLSQEEATLLLRKGLAITCDTPKSFPAPSKEDVERFNELRHDSVVKQIELFQKGREEKQLELAKVIEEGRRRKRKRTNVDNEEKEILAAKKLKSEDNKEADECMEEQEFTPLDMKCDEGSIATEELEDQDTYSRVEDMEYHSGTPSTLNHKKQETKDRLHDESDMPNTSVKSDIDCEETKAISKLGTLIHIPMVMPQRLQSFPSVDWTYPQTESERLHYRIFSDLWEKGYYLTSGIKFGGDLLAYPGDPMRYHSFYIVIIIPWGKKVTPFDIISAGRLGSTVKKTALLCSVSDTNEVVYISVKWSGTS